MVKNTFVSGTLLHKKESVVKVGDEEIIMMLRAYIVHPTKWNIIHDMRENIDQLNEKTRDYYRH